MARIGDRIASYELTAVIASGAMGTVYRANDSRLGREVALKLLAPNLSRDPMFRARFERESRVTAGLRHPNIVPVFEAGEWLDQLYIAMQLIDGPSLASIIARRRHLPTKQVVSIVSQLAGALDAAHVRGIVHRDVKPGNVLLLEDARGEGSDHAYLVDFGVTRSVDSADSMTRTGVFMGTLSYIAPEQLAAGHVDGRADQYALASTAFEMLSSTPPFVRDNQAALMWAHLNAPAPTLSSVRPDLPSGLTPVLQRAMAKDPDERYASSGAFASALSAAARAVTPAPAPATSIALTVSAAVAQDAPTVEAPPPTAREARIPPPRDRRRQRRGWMPVAAGLLAFALTALVAYSAFILLGSPGESQRPDATLPVAVVPSPSRAASVDVLPTDLLTFPPVTLAPGETASPSVVPTRTARPTRNRTPTPGHATQPPPTPTASATPSATPTATPTATPDPTTRLPVAATGTWAVTYSRNGTSGSPPTELGDHNRTYDIQPACETESDCRMLATTYDSAGNFVGRITFRWNGSLYRYTGDARYYSRQGGSTCVTEGGDTVTGAYETAEVVRVEPERYADDRVVEFVGTKVISGTPTDIGTANGCEPYSLSYGARLTR